MFVIALYICTIITCYLNIEKHIEKCTYIVDNSRRLFSHVTLIKNAHEHLVRPTFAAEGKSYRQIPKAIKPD